MKAVAELKNQFSDFRQFVKHLKTSLFVGILLNLINQGEALISLKTDDIHFFNLALTFFVPFAVSLYATISNNISHPWKQ